MNSKNSNIYELSKHIQENQERAFEMEARQIANAYRKVQQLKVKKPYQNQEQKKVKQPSTYAMKIKETLKEINTKKAKEMESLSKNLPERKQVKPQKREISKLQIVSINKIFGTIQSYHKRMLKRGLGNLLDYIRQEIKQQDGFITKFKVFKIFRAWKDEIILSKLERNKRNRVDQVGQLKRQQMVKQFYAFLLKKKSFKGWYSQISKQKKRKQYEAELRKRQIQQSMKQIKKPITQKLVQQNNQLQNKVRGFIDGLKSKIQNKDRLKTIKQKTQQSDFRIKLTQQSGIHGQSIEQNCQQDIEDVQYQMDQQNQSNIARQGQVQPTIDNIPKKPMNDQQLQLRRKQLEQKHRHRKQMLEKLKREKDEKKRYQNQQKMQLERQIQIQQRRVKQQKYKNYIKNKQDQQQWQKRQKILTLQAQNFDRIRLMKYYGWKPLTSIKKIKKAKAEKLYETLLLIMYRLKGHQFLREIEQISTSIIDRQYERMSRRFKLAILRRSFKCFLANRKQQFQKKQQYKIMHEVNTLKIVLESWKRLIPQLIVENFDWERPRYIRAQQFNKIQLMQKGLRSLKINKDQEQMSRNIQNQKDKIKNKIKNMLGDNESINYQQFL